MFNGGVNPFANDEKGQTKADDLPFYFIGFKSAAPEFTLRAQTLYRTTSGMMKVIKLMYRVENPEVVQLLGGNTDRLDASSSSWRGGNSNLLFRCNGIPNSTGKSMRTPNFYCAIILIFKLRTLKRSRPGRKAETHGYSPLSSMATASLCPKPDVVDPSSVSSFPAIQFSGTASLTTKTMQSFSTVASICSSLTRTRTTNSRSVSKFAIASPNSKSIPFQIKVPMDTGITRTSRNHPLSSSVLVNISFRRILVFWVTLPPGRNKHSVHSLLA